MQRYEKAHYKEVVRNGMPLVFVKSSAAIKMDRIIK